MSMLKSPSGNTVNGCTELAKNSKCTMLYRSHRL